MSLPASGSQVHMLQEMFPDVPDTVIKQVALQEPLLEKCVSWLLEYKESQEEITSEIDNFSDWSIIGTTATAKEIEPNNRSVDKENPSPPDLANVSPNKQDLDHSYQDSDVQVLKQELRAVYEEQEIAVLSARRIVRTTAIPTLILKTKSEETTPCERLRDWLAKTKNRIKQCVETQSLLEQLKAAFNSCEEECGEAMLSIASGVAKGVKEFAAEMERIAKSASTTGCDGN